MMHSPKNRAPAAAIVLKVVMFLVPVFSLSLLGLYSTQSGNNKQFYDHWFVMWTREKLISMMLSIQIDHRRIRQIQFGVGFIQNGKFLTSFPHLLDLHSFSGYRGVFLIKVTGCWSPAAT